MSEWQEENDWGQNGSDEFAPGLSGGAYEPTLGDVIDNIQTLAKRVMGPLLVAWGIVAVIQLVLVIIQVAAHYVLGPASLAFMFVSIPVLLLIGIVLGAVRFSLYRPMRSVMTDGPGAVPDLGSLQEPILSNFLNVMLASILYGLSVVIGLVFCIIPGLVAAVVFAMAPYYAANGTPAVEAMRDAMESAQKHTVLLVAGMGASIVLAGFIQAGVQIVVLIVSSFLGEYAFIVSQLTSWMLQVAVGAAIWVILGGTFVTIDLADSGEHVAH